MNILKKLLFVLSGLFLTSLGIKILTDNLLTFGGTAGIATISAYWFPLSWGVIFFIVNLPFFLISFQQLGKWFTLSSFISIIGISITKDGLSLFLPTLFVHDIIAAGLAGLFIGIGVTFVLNNGSSLGGIHILAMYLEKRLEINRGIVIFVSDSLIIVFAIMMVGIISALYSIFAIVIASYIIGRYKASPIKAVVEDEEEAITIQGVTNS